MILDITSDLRDVNVMPSTEIEEIAQNVQMILLTHKYSVPMDRTFGLNASMIDQPITATQARLAAEVAAAIREQEPRARVLKVKYTGDTADGQLKVKVKVEIIEKRLRGGVFRKVN